MACRSLVRSLMSMKDVSTFVICGCPISDNMSSNIRHLSSVDFSHSLQTSEENIKNIFGVAIPLSTWYRTDIQSSHSEFCAGVCSVFDSIIEFGADLCLEIDWSGSMAIRFLRESNNIQVPSIYFAFCCYSSLSGISEEDRTFYLEQESLSMKSSVLTVALCPGDERKLRSMSPSANFRLLLPPLRFDIHRLVQSESENISRRRFITCCLRLHPSKNVDVFIEAVGLLKDLFIQKNLVPVLCGAAADIAYAEACRSKLRRTCPDSVIHTQFLNAEELVNLFRETKLNVHTALYEAYGMTIIEAAAGGKCTISRKGFR